MGGHPASKLPLGVLFLLLLGPGLFLRGGGLVLHVGISDRSVAPWTYPDREGLGQELLRLAVEAQGDRIEVTPLPWRRCLEMARAGAIDVPLMASPSTANLEFLVFPMKGGQPDVDKCISAANFSVLCRKDAGVEWDGRAFHGLASPVLYASGQAIVKDRIEALGVPGNDSPNTYPQIGDMILSRRYQVAVMRETIALTLVGSEARFKEALALLPAPFLVDYSYAPASRAFAKEHTDYLERIWTRIKEIRGTRAWRQKEAKALEEIVQGHAP